MTAWSWKDGDVALNPELNLLYEPGNWGDILKSLWAVEVVSKLAGELCVLDPFSGALDYPCTDATRARLKGSALAPFRTLQKDYLKRARLASTGRLIQDAARQRGLPVHSVIAEVDPARRATWDGQAEPSEKPALDLLNQASKRFQLIHWDPYDFFEQWSHALPRLSDAGHKIPVLIYVYNKAPRGVGQMRNYQQMRERIQGSALFGRVPADGFLPRAFHEMILLAPPALLESVAGTLSALTAKLHRHITDPSCFEKQLTGHRYAEVKRPT